MINSDSYWSITTVIVNDPNFGSYWGFLIAAQTALSLGFFTVVDAPLHNRLSVESQQNNGSISRAWTGHRTDSNLPLKWCGKGGGHHQWVGTKGATSCWSCLIFPKKWWSVIRSLIISNASKKLGIGGFGKAAILYPVLRTTVTNFTRPCR